MSESNLIPLNKRSKGEAREISRRGGINSGKKRKQKKETKEIIEMILNSKPPADVKKRFKELYPNLDFKTVDEICNGSMIRKIMSGDVKAYNAIYDRKDGKPTQKIVHDGGVDLSKGVLDKMNEQAKKSQNELKLK